MDVRIGVTDTPREIEVDLGDDGDQDKVQKLVEDALAKSDHVLWLTDRKGRRVGVPSARIAFVEIGSEKSSERRIGFVG